MHDVWWEYGELYAVTCLQWPVQYVQLDRTMSCCGGKRIFAPLAWEMIREKGNAWTDGSRHPVLLYQPCSKLREQEGQPESHVDIWTSSMKKITWLKCYSQSAHKRHFLHQNLGNKAKGSGVWLWATWRALFSNSLAETGIGIHPSPVLGNTDTAFQTAVVLQIWELRQRKKKSVIFTKISKNSKPIHGYYLHLSQTDQ